MWRRLTMALLSLSSRGYRTVLNDEWLSAEVGKKSLIDVLPQNREFVDLIENLKPRLVLEQ